MKTRWPVVGAVAVALAVACIGCGKRQSAQSPASTATSSIPLPEWAPKNPSAEFLRAAAVLNVPPTLEEMRGVAKSEMEAQANVARLTSYYTLAYELFGSLTDEQIRQFETAWEVRIPVKSASKKQRAALEKWFNGKAKGAFTGDFDPLVILYKHGAKEDLSNVEFGFDHGGIPPGSATVYSVTLCWWVKQPDGKTDAFNTGQVGLTDASQRR
jgi:hypothetical protein